MIRYIRWSALIAVAGTFVLGALLIYLAHTTTTLVVPAEGGTYVEGVAGGPTYLNPLLSGYNQVDGDLVSLIFSGLTEINERGEVVPDLALRWDISEDGLTYTFYLRPDVRWHDGEPLTADDVVFTIEALQEPDFQGPPELATLWQAVTAEKRSDHIVSFTLQEPFAPFLAYTTLGILPKHILKGVPATEFPPHPFSAHPVGTGPFRILELTAEHALLEANPYYYGQKPYLDKVEFRFYRDYGEIFAAYQRGEVEGISRILPPDLDRVRQAEGLSLYSTWLSGYNLIFLNLEAPVFQEKEVRQALLWAIDRQRIIDQILDGQGLVVDSPILPNSWAYDEDIPRYDYNPQRAKALLEEAGWVDTDNNGVREKEGVPLEFPLLTNDDPLRVRIIEEIAMELAEVGMRVHTQVLGYGASEILQSRHFTAVLYGWGDLPPDPDLYEMWHSTQTTDEGQNYGGFANRDVDELLEQARLINDPIQRAELYRRFQEIFAQEVPALLLYYPIYNYAVGEQVKGVQLAPLSIPSDRFRTIADWYVNTKRVMVSETLQ